MSVNKTFLLLLLLSVDALAAYMSIFRPPAHSVRHSKFASRDLSSQNYGRFSRSFSGSYNVQPPYPFEQEPLYPVAQEPLYPVAQEPLYPVAQEPLYPVAQEPLYPATQEPLYPFEQEPLYPFEQEPLYPFEQEPLYPVAQEPPYPFEQEPLYPFEQEPLYPAAQDLVYPSAELPLYSTTTQEPLNLSTKEAFNSSNTQPLIPESDTRVFKSPVSKHKEVLSLINEYVGGPASRKPRSTPEWRILMKAFEAVWSKEWITTSLARYEPSKGTWAYFS
nr:gamma-gliadin-like [Procambarus clarkii]